MLAEAMEGLSNTTRRGFRPTALRVATLGCAMAILAPETCWALQPLSVFVAQARTFNPSNREAAATVLQRAAETSSATANLLPSFDARGTYTRNEYDVIIALPTASGGVGPPITVQPLNQWDASFKATVPILDVGAWERRAAGKTTQSAAVASRDATDLDVERQVTRAYFQLLGAEALLASARRTQAVAEKSAVDVDNRRKNGVASELDLQRAIAEVASDRQDVAGADYQVVQNRRALQSLSGVEPTSATEFVDEDLREEPPLETFLRPPPHDLLSVASSTRTRVAAEQTLDAAKLAWVPTVSAAAEERLTNATSFIGHGSYYLLTATAAWHVDFGTDATVRQRRALAEEARAREQKSQLDAEDSIFNAWHQVRVDIEKARAARAQVAAALLSQSLSQDRYVAGIATQLDFLQAQRDAFRADVSRIQADTDLAYARAALRIDVTRVATGKESGR